MTSGSTFTHLMVIAASVPSDAAVEPAQQGVALMAVAGKPAVLAEHRDGCVECTVACVCFTWPETRGGDADAFAQRGQVGERHAAAAVDRADPLGVLGEPARVVARNAHREPLSEHLGVVEQASSCLLYTSPSPRD